MASFKTNCLSRSRNTAKVRKQSKQVTWASLHGKTKATSLKTKHTLDDRFILKRSNYSKSECSSENFACLPNYELIVAEIDHVDLECKPLH